MNKPKQQNGDGEPSLDVTRILDNWADGDKEALDKLWTMVYDQLRGEANRVLRSMPAGQTLQSTALVNEVFIRLVDGRKLQFNNRDQFFWFAGQTMRHSLVEHARKRMASKRGGKAGPRLTLNEELSPNQNSQMDYPTLIAIDDALKRLEHLDPRQRKVIELRFFVGMNIKEISEALGISLATIKRDWGSAKRYLYLELTRKDRPS